MPRDQPIGGSFTGTLKTIFILQIRLIYNRFKKYAKTPEDQLRMFKLIFAVKALSHNFPALLVW